MCRNTVQDASCEYQMRAQIGPYGENLRPRVTVNVTIAQGTAQESDPTANRHKQAAHLPPRGERVEGGTLGGNLSGTRRERPGKG